MKLSRAVYTLWIALLLGVSAFPSLSGWPPAQAQADARGQIDDPYKLYLPLIVDRRALVFSGRIWEVKESDTPVGPGPNYFSSDARDVYVDSQGWLHLKIVNRNGKWYSTEVVSRDAFGYGTYTFDIYSGIEFDPNVVLGLFTWDDTAPQYNYREIDIEFSKFGDPDAENSSYTVQPWQTLANTHPFDLFLPQGAHSTHWFRWQAAAIDFRSASGGTTLHEWTYTGADIPPAGSSALNARMNLWLLNPPVNGQPVEAVIRSFTFESELPPTPCPPKIEFTNVPPIGSSSNLTGRVACVTPGEYKAAVYIFVNGGWWTKPTWSAPLTTIQANATWTCDITTGGDDKNATQIIAFLLPNGKTPPQAGGLSVLPAELFDYAYMRVER